jgi:nucleoid-associated protein YgaU
MNFKNLLKSIKMNESTISMLLGLLVIIILGVLFINLLGKRGLGKTIPAVGTEQQNIKLPTNHIVEKGEDLWKISEKYYNSGYNWTDIVKANNIKNPNILLVGQNLIIPNVEPKILNKPEAIPTPTTVTQLKKGNNQSVTNVNENTTGIYTVVKGDCLWKIALSVYANGYKWVDIAKANNLKNPSIIHPGNKFILPR